MKKENNNVIIGVACALTSDFIYALSPVFTKTVTNTTSPFSLLAWRFFTAFVIMSLLIVFRVIKVDFKGKSKKPLLLVCLFSPCLYYIAETFGIANTTTFESGIIFACLPLALVVASTLILKKKPSKMQVIGIVIALAGVILNVVAVGVNSSLSVTGYFFLVMAVVTYAVFSAFAEKASEFSELELTYSMIVAGAAVFTVVGFIDALAGGTLNTFVILPFTDTSFMVTLLYQGIGCSILAFFLSHVGISKLGVNGVSSFIGLSTVVSLVAGVVFLHETFYALQIVGAVIIIAGVYISNKSKKKELSVSGG